MKIEKIKETLCDGCNKYQPIYHITLVSHKFNLCEVCCRDLANEFYGGDEVYDK